ncbi:MAG: NAD(P)/FAD-dependent oxidoreductase [Verrucomicrobiota bacterium]
MKKVRKQVVILGAGFGGLACAKRLANTDCEVTIIDKNNHHLFQPLLYQVATAGLSMPEIAKPIRSSLPKNENIHVIMDEVSGINLHEKIILTPNRTVKYDYLVIGLGVVNDYFGHDEWAKHTVGLKSLEEASKIRNSVLHAYERAELSDNPKEQQRLMTMVVIGGGPTGVEMAGALAELAHHVLPRDFKNINPKNSRIILAEASDKILGQFSEPLPCKAKDTLEKMGVEMMLSSPVKDIRHKRVEFDDVAIDAENIIWAAGVGAPAITRSLDVPVDRSGKILVNPDCTLPDHPEVFAIGDIVKLTDPLNQKVPGVSPAAIQMGNYVAKHIKNEIDSSTPMLDRKPFVYFDKGSMATIGRSAAVASIGKINLSGFIAWTLWLFIHLVFLIGFRNKIAVLVQWVYSYVNYKRGARIITNLKNPQQLVSEDKIKSKITVRH